MDQLSFPVTARFPLHDQVRTIPRLWIDRPTEGGWRDVQTNLRARSGHGGRIDLIHNEQREIHTQKSQPNLKKKVHWVLGEDWIIFRSRLPGQNFLIRTNLKNQGRQYARRLDLPEPLDVRDLKLGVVPGERLETVQSRQIIK